MKNPNRVPMPMLGLCPAIAHHYRSTNHSSPMVHLEFTGKVSFVAIFAAVLFAWFLQEVPSLVGGSSSAIAVIRWTSLAFFCAAVFLVGRAANKKKGLRRGPDGKMALGSPNTIFYVPLQYWAFIYFFGLSCAIMVWQTKEP